MINTRAPYGANKIGRLFSQRKRKGNFWKRDNNDFKTSQTGSNKNFVSFSERNTQGSPIKELAFHKYSILVLRFHFMQHTHIFSRWFDVV